MPLERKLDQPVEQRCVRDSARLEQLRIDARRGEPGDRIELVDDHGPVRADEEVHAGHAFAVGGDERRDGDVPNPTEHILWQPCGNDQLHAAVRVLRVEVVPVRVGDDLSDRRGNGTTIPQDADLHLDAGLELLDQDLFVVAPRERDGRLELVLRAHLRDANRRSHSSGLDEHGVAKGIVDGVALPEGHAACHENAAVAQHRFEQILVHAERRRRHARADVGHGGQFEQALHGPVLAERPVQDRQHDVHGPERCGHRRRRDRQRADGSWQPSSIRGGRQRPRAVSADFDHVRLVSRRVECVDD